MKNLLIALLGTALAAGAQTTTNSGLAATVLPNPIPVTVRVTGFDQVRATALGNSYWELSARVVLDRPFRAMTNGVRVFSTDPTITIRVSPEEITAVTGTNVNQLPVAALEPAIRAAALGKARAVLAP